MEKYAMRSSRRNSPGMGFPPLGGARRVLRIRHPVCSAAAPDAGALDVAAGCVAPPAAVVRACPARQQALDPSRPVEAAQESPRIPAPRLAAQEPGIAAVAGAVIERAIDHRSLLPRTQFAAPQRIVVGPFQHAARSEEH